MLEESSLMDRETIEEPSEIKIDEIADILEREPEKKSKGIKLAQFFLPFIIAGIFYLCLFLLLTWDTFRTVGALSLAYFLPPAGKESVIPVGVAAGIHPLLMAIAVAFLDIITGLFLVWNFDFARKIPLLGRWIKKFEKKGEKTLQKHRYIEALSFVGVVLFVMFPFQGSGGVGASIIGRLVGMNPYKIWVAIIIGAICGCLLIAYASETFKAIFMRNALAGVLILIAIFGLVIFYIVRRRKSAIVNSADSLK